MILNVMIKEGRVRRLRRVITASSLVGVAACGTTGTAGPSVPAPTESRAPETAEVGVLLMAHGGDEAWNRSVNEAMEALPAHVPAVVAYGMANPVTLREGLERLEEQGVRRVVVVRAFLSGRSFFDQTRWYLGLASDPPEHFVLMGHAGAHPSRESLDHGLTVATHREGLLDAPQAARIMAARGQELSRAPAGESVLLLAHGMGDERENREVLNAMEAIAGEVRRLGFADVRAATLREDWEAERRVAEAELRAYVGGQVEQGRRVLVLPVRLSGFGPYAEVLEGLEYEAGRGLLPHPAVAEWVLATANRVACGEGWGPLSGQCPRVVAPEAGAGR